MAVGNNLTLVEDMESGGPTLTNWPSGGQGASNDTDLFFVGAAATSKKVSGETKGFWMNPGSTFDLSGTGEHVKVYFANTTPTKMTALNVGIGHTANSAYESHSIDLSAYPDLAGWVPVWVEVDAGTDTGTPDFTIADEFGVQVANNATSGNLKNVLADQIHHGTRAALTWDGTGGDLDDFITSEDTNAWGVLTLRNGVYFCYANMAFGSSTATTFDFDDQTIAFPNAIWLPSASTWMGIDVDLQHASTAITGTGGTILGGATRKPDFIVTGTSGTLDVTARVFNNMRIVTFTSGVTADNATVSNSGVVTGGGGSFLGTSILTSTVAADAAAFIYDTNADPDGELDNMSFSKGTNAHHAIELKSNTPAAITLRGWTVTGFNASDEQNDSVIYNTSGKTITVSVVGNTGTVSKKDSGAGSETIISVDPVAHSVNVKDEDGTNLSGVRVFTWPTDNTGPIPYEETVTQITRSATTATVSHTGHGLVTDQYAWIEGANQPEYNGVHQVAVTDANTYTYTVSGSPATPATGTITSTGLILNGTTDGSGNISYTRSYSTDQDVQGRVRSASGSTKYRPSTYTSQIKSASGSTVNIVLQADE